MISGLDDVDAVARCIASGADDYLPKPFNPVLLKARDQRGSREKAAGSTGSAATLHASRPSRSATDALLHAVLPGQIVARLKGGEQVIADRFTDVTVLFADIVGFTPIAARLPATDLVGRLGAMFEAFDGSPSATASRRSRRSATPTWRRAGMPEAAADHADRIVGSRRVHARCPRPSGSTKRPSASASASIPGRSWRA